MTSHENHHSLPKEHGKDQFPVKVHHLHSRVSNPSSYIRTEYRQVPLHHASIGKIKLQFQVKINHSGNAID